MTALTQPNDDYSRLPGKLLFFSLQLSALLNLPQSPVIVASFSRRMWAGKKAKTNKAYSISQLLGSNIEEDK